MANDGTVKIGTELDEEGFRSGLKKLGSVASTGLKAAGALIAGVGTAAAGAVGGLLALESATEEYRIAQGKLNTAFETAGYSADTAKEVYRDFFGILGDVDTATEASQLLAKLSNSQQDLSTWTDIAAGVWGTFGDSLPIEGLIESANETAKVGEVTGVLADSLNWAGISEEKFNEKLADCSDESERNQLIMDTLSSTYDEASDAFYRNNEALVEARDNQAMLDDTLADLSGTVSDVKNKLMSEFLPSIANVADAFSDMISGVEGADDEFVDAVDDIVDKAMNKLPEFLEFGTRILTSVVSGITKAVPRVVAQVPRIVGQIGEAIGDAINVDIDAEELERSVESLAKTFIDLAPAIAGTTAAVVSFRTAMTITQAINAFKTANEAATVAQAALNAVMNVNPYVLAATAIAGVTAALGAMVLMSKEAPEPLQVLTEEQQKVTESAIEAADAFNEQQKATQNSMSVYSTQMENIQGLADELMGLADASGKVAEKDQERANFILTKMNEALGTEYQMVGGVIQQYGDLKAEIDDVIQSKLANSLLEAANADYMTALQNEAEALERVRNAETELTAQKEYALQREAEIAQEREKILEQLQTAREEGNSREEQLYTVQLARLDGSLAAEQQTLAEKQAAYDDALAQYGEYHDTILNYQDAEEAALTGNYEKVKQLLIDKGEAYGGYSDKVDEETAKVLDTLYEEAQQAGAEAERMKRNFENGVDGFTEEMVREAEQGHEDALKAYSNAYSDAEGIGEDLGSGLKKGMSNMSSSLYRTASSIVSGIISTMRVAADSHSPSKKTIALGEDIGEGTVVGMDRKVPEIKKAATRQVSAVLDTMKNSRLDGDIAFGTIQARMPDIQSTVSAMAPPVTYSVATTSAAGSDATVGVLEQILAAIKEGKIMMVDKQVLGKVTSSAQRNSTKALGVSAY